MKGWDFYRHMPVLLANGRRLGHTQEIGHAVDYLHVRQGSLVVRDWYVPIAAVRDVTDRGVRLTVDQADVVRNRWHVPPEDYLARQGATPGYEYMSPADSPPGGGASASRPEHE